MYRLCLVALVLAACTPEMWDACRQYGFSPGTEGYANCKMQESQTQRVMGAAMVAGNPYLRP